MTTAYEKALARRLEMYKDAFVVGVSSAYVAMANSVVDPLFVQDHNEKGVRLICDSENGKGEIVRNRFMVGRAVKSEAQIEMFKFLGLHDSVAEEFRGIEDRITNKNYRHAFDWARQLADTLFAYVELVRDHQSRLSTDAYLSYPGFASGVFNAYRSALGMISSITAIDGAAEFLRGYDIGNLTLGKLQSNITPSSLTFIKPDSIKEDSYEARIAFVKRELSDKFGISSV